VREEIGEKLFGMRIVQPLMDVSDKEAVFWLWWRSLSGWSRLAYSENFMSSLAPGRAKGHGARGIRDITTGMFTQTGCASC
jgi:hypothetical protein